MRWWRLALLGALVATLVLVAGSFYRSGLERQGRREFWTAVERGDVQTVHRWLHRLPDLARDRRSGLTVLGTAAQNRKTDLVRYCLDHGFPVDERDDGERTALSYVVSHDDPALARMLLDAGADVNSADRNGWTSLMRALAARSRRQRRIPVGGRAYRTEPAAHLGTASSGVQLLLARGADVRAARRDGRTALMVAAEHGELDAAVRLLRAGADPRAAERTGDDALTLAAGQGLPELVELLLRHGASAEGPPRARQSPLTLAAGRARWRVARILLAAGADPLRKGVDGSTPLLAAASASVVRSADLTPQREQAALIRELLRRGASSRQADAKRQTPLMGVASGGNLTAVRLLVEAGADVNARDARGNRALSLAARGDGPIVEYLLARGAHPDPSPGSESPALVAAAAEARADAVRKLLAAGAEVDRTDSQGRTALMAAVAMPLAPYRSPADARKVEETVRMLVAAGADPAVRDRQGRTALDLARRNRYRQAAALLQKTGTTRPAHSSGTLVHMRLPR